MRLPGSQMPNRALTLLEVLVVLGILVVLVAMILPSLSNGRPSKVVRCRANLKNCYFATTTWIEDNSKQPMQPIADLLKANNLEIHDSPLPWFTAISDYTGASDYFTCPADGERKALSHEADKPLQALNLSYFLNLDAQLLLTNSLALSGDRNLTVDGTAAKSGLLAITNRNRIGWTRALHGESFDPPGGNILLTDGHIEFTREYDLTRAFRQGQAVTSQLVIP